MKRAMVYLIVLSALMTALLSGCGESKANPSDTVPGTVPPAAPETTMLPENMLPDESDGVVNDTDGIITEGDNGGSLGGVTGNGTAGGTTIGGSGSTSGGTTGGQGGMGVGTNGTGSMASGAGSRGTGTQTGMQ